MNGLFSETLKVELNEAEQRKAILTQTLNTIVKTEIKPITVEQIKTYIKRDKEALETGDTFEIKNVINSYIRKMLVSPEYINVVSIVDIIGGGGGS
jgi:hypothetical protein